MCLPDIWLALWQQQVCGRNDSQSTCEDAESSNSNNAAYTLPHAAFADAGWLICVRRTQINRPVGTRSLSLCIISHVMVNMIRMPNPQRKYLFCKSSCSNYFLCFAYHCSGPPNASDSGMENSKSMDSPMYSPYMSAPADVTPIMHSLHCCQSLLVTTDLAKDCWRRGPIRRCCCAGHAG